MKEVINELRTNVGFFGALFLISWIFIGNFILLNFFLAILLDGFTKEFEQIEQPPTATEAPKEKVS